MPMRDAPRRYHVRGCSLCAKESAEQAVAFAKRRMPWAGLTVEPHREWGLMFTVPKGTSKKIVDAADFFLVGWFGAMEDELR